MRILYSILMYLMTPLMFGYLALRGFRDHRYWQGWGQRLGFGRPPEPPGGYLVHAASVGEVSAAAPLVRALQERTENSRVLLTTLTPTGAARARELLAEQATVCFLPFDLPGATARFLRRHSPARLIVLETEIWPNLFHAAARQGRPVVIANARMSARSLRGYTRLGGWIRPALATVSNVLAQSEDDAARFRQCGAPPQKVAVTGNLKFDVRPPAAQAERAEALRAGWGVGRPTLVAGSTHPGDEAIILPAFSEVLAGFPGALLILAPRHPERFASVAARIRAQGLSLHQVSGQGTPSPGTQCLLVDRMGLLPDFYAAADVCFVGGTLEPLGGHNLLEPAVLGKPLLFGPHTANVLTVSEQLLAAGAARRVSCPADFAAAVGELFADEELRNQMGRKALDLVAAGGGALERTLASIAALPEHPL